MFTIYSLSRKLPVGTNIYEHKIFVTIAQVLRKENVKYLGLFTLIFFHWLQKNKDKRICVGKNKL